MINDYTSYSLLRTWYIEDKDNFEHILKKYIQHLKNHRKELEDISIEAIDTTELFNDIVSLFR